MNNWKTYEPWLEDLKDLASIENVDLSIDKYHYHIYFVKGWHIEAVIDDLIQNDQGDA